MSAWRNNLVRRPLSLYEWLVTATNCPSPRVFSLPIAPEIGNSLPSLPFLTVQTDPRLIFRLVFHRNDQIVRRSIDSQMYDTYYIEMISIMASERRQELMHSRISFKRGEQLFREHEIPSDNNIIDIDATHQIRNYYLNIFVWRGNRIHGILFVAI